MNVTVKPKVLLLDADNLSLQATDRVLRATFTVIAIRAAGDVQAAMMAHGDAKLFIMTTSKGSDPLGVLNAVRRAKPKMPRLLLTAFEDLTVIVEGLHDGSVQRVLSKPLQFAELIAALPRSDSSSAVMTAPRIS